MSSGIPLLSVLSDGFIPFYKCFIWLLITVEFYANYEPDCKDSHAMPWKAVEVVSG